MVPKMDNAEGWEGWKCHVLPDCMDGNEFVHCTGNYEHGPPFGDMAGVDHNSIMWNFMKRHARNGDKKKK